MYLKNEVLYATRLAMHLSLDKAVMGDFDLESGAELQVRKIIRLTLNDVFWQTLIESEYGKWFFGGEAQMWNMAIEKRLPQMERLITKKSEYFMHQLKYKHEFAANEKSGDHTFAVFEFRREVARAIWANLNMELVYYTNANDERFSI